jgi:hypothetical protein
MEVGVEAGARVFRFQIAFIPQISLIPEVTFVPEISLTLHETSTPAVAVGKRSAVGRIALTSIPETISLN